MVQGKKVTGACNRCGRVMFLKARGQCWSCSRETVPVVHNNKGDRSAGSHNAPRPASYAVTHRPGSEGKVAEMERRVGRGEAVFHPGDAGHDK